MWGAEETAQKSVYIIIKLTQKLENAAVIPSKSGEVLSSANIFWSFTRKNSVAELSDWNRRRQESRSLNELHFYL